MRKRKLIRKLPKNSLDDLYFDLVILSQKINGLSSLFMKVATNEGGITSSDDSSVGIGEILADYSNQMKSIAGEISEHALADAQNRVGFEE